MLFLTLLSCMVVFDPMEAKGPTVLFFKVTPSPIKQGSMIFELIELNKNHLQLIQGFFEFLI